MSGDYRPSQTGTIRVNDADRQILFGLVAIRLKLVSLAQVSRALSDWSTDGERSLARLLIERRQLDEASGALVESAVVHHVTMAGGDAASSLESFAGSEDLEALRHVLERTIEAGGVQRRRRSPAADSRPASGTATGQRLVEAARRDARQSRCGRPIARDADPRRRFLRRRPDRSRSSGRWREAAWAKCSWPGTAGSTGKSP